MSLIKDLLLWLFTNLRTAKDFFRNKRATETRRGTNDFHNVILVEVFAKIIGKKAKLSSFPKFF